MTSATQRVDQALETGATTLDLSNLRLTKLPPRLAELTHLTELRLDNNWLTDLPDWLATLTNLSVLRLDSNSLLELPDWLATLTNLTDLRLSDNHLIGLPYWLATIPNLTSLGIGGCNLNAVPTWLPTGLTQLWLHNNRLTDLPHELPDLALLNLDNNCLTELPPWLAACARLTELRDADFRALEAMFATLDPAKTWGGLSKTTTPEGLTLYLCAEHLAQYRG